MIPRKMRELGGEIIDVDIVVIEFAELLIGVMQLTWCNRLSAAAFVFHFQRDSFTASLALGYRSEVLLQVVLIVAKTIIGKQSRNVVG